MWQSTSRYPAPQRQDTQSGRHAAPSMVRLEVDAASGELLRAVVICAGGDAVRFLRIDACARSGAVRALLCVEADAAPALRREVLRRLPGCSWQPAPHRGEQLHAC
ncbi:hypothetical protein [Massilia sp. YIM B02443]|uniref:hypothetical protein n=1 Tax=Massilia sp. YIM B02443 TaxID=3050127 RepID=UPI0025B70167|nr:hypothetical protein [Massilia sp. YIM B02443]MDN4038274.1 hypothetical protein [Massilia sp. YIM B02443]